MNIDLLPVVVEVAVSALVRDAEPIMRRNGRTRMRPMAIEALYLGTPGGPVWEVQVEVTGPSVRANGKNGTVAAREVWVCDGDFDSVADAPEWVREFVKANMPPLPLGGN